MSATILTFVEILPVLFAVDDFGAVEGGQAEVGDAHRETTVDDAIRRTESTMRLDGGVVNETHAL